jgi:hypothetical protein
LNNARHCLCALAGRCKTAKFDEKCFSFHFLVSAISRFSSPTAQFASI